MNKINAIRTLLLCLAFATTLSSCVTKKYTSPSVDANGMFRGDDSTATDTTTIADIPWREYFKDPILQNLISEGLKNNFDLKIAFERIKQTEMVLDVAENAYFPNVSLVGGASQTRDNKNSFLKDHTENYSLAVSVSWQSFIWAQLQSQKKARYAQFLNSYAYKNLTRTSLISTIATSYYSLLSLDEQLKITQETIILLEKNLETMRALMISGQQTRAAVDQSESLLYSAQVSVPALESSINSIENSLSTLIGRVPGYIERSSLDDQTVVSELKHGIPAQMLARRPDVQQAELSFRSAFELTNAARASFYPSISIGVNSPGTSLGYSTANTLSNFFKPENIFASIVGGIVQPIFDKKVLINQLHSAQADQNIAFLNFKKTVLNASQEVSTLLYSYQSSLSKNPLREKQVEVLKQAVSDTQKLLESGNANYTEVLTAEQNLLNAQLNQVSDKLEQLQDGVNLYVALGGGIQ